MAILTLNITDFRNLPSFAMDPLATGCNIICGQNGSGKTSILEAIHALLVGKSFRQHHARQLIRSGSNKFVVFSQLLDAITSQNVSIGIEREITGEMKWRMNAADVGAATEVAALFPARVINSHAHDMIEQGPMLRRKFLDWGLFYQFDSFITCYRKFDKILKHRNALLYDAKLKREARNTSHHSMLASWTEALIQQAAILTDLREQYVRLFIPCFVDIMRALLDIPHLHLEYDRGWPKEASYEVVLAEAAETDARLGHTQYGPHCADLHVLIDHTPAKHTLSRGQQKLLVSAMLLAQGALLKSTHQKPVIYLVDDLPSELDESNRQNLLSLLLSQQTQVFITAIEKESIISNVSPSSTPIKLFHVKQC